MEIKYKEIFKTENFIVGTLLEPKPHVSREDGGHIFIIPIKEIPDRTELSRELAIEMMKLSMICGIAMKKVLNEQGIDIERINYQENGNWVPKFHWHLYGRAKSAKVHKFGESLNFPRPETGFYDSHNPLTDEDIKKLNLEITNLLNSPKFKNF